MTRGRKPGTPASNKLTPEELGERESARQVVTAKKKAAIIYSRFLPNGEPNPLAVLTAPMFTPDWVKANEFPMTCFINSYSFKKCKPKLRAMGIAVSILDKPGGEHQVAYVAKLSIISSWRYKTT